MPRRLSDEDRAAWERVAQTARRLEPMRDPVPQAPPRAFPPDPGAPAPPAPLPPLIRRVTPEPALRLDLVPPLAQRLAVAVPQLDGALDRRLARGQKAPDRRIDLHGMTRDQARAALTGFLIAAQARGDRLVLAITGKGRERGADDLAPIPRRPGAIRHDLPHWISQPPLRALVVDLRAAHRRHGGDGAYYIYLRRNR
jgi:DNA-nicking Smr family endonuclease